MITQILKEKNFKELRDKMLSVCPKPSLGIKADKFIPPCSKKYALMGYAFEIFLTLLVERLNKVRTDPSSPWHRYDYLDAIATNIILKNESEIRIGSIHDPIIVKKTDVYERVSEMAQFIKKSYKTYKGDGMATVDLMKSCIFLAAFRLAGVHIADKSIMEDCSAEANELMQMTKLVDKGNFTATKRAIISPVFPIIGGPGDLIIDDTIVEIKTTVDFGLKSDHFLQLIGYYITHIAKKENQKGGNVIRNIAIYFPRQGIWWKRSLESIASDKQFLELSDWFIRYITLNVRPCGYSVYFDRETCDFKNRTKYEEISKLKNGSKKTKLLNQLDSQYLVFKNSDKRFFDNFWELDNVDNNEQVKDTYFRTEEKIRARTEKINNFMSQHH